jgi:hypothetical protein
VKVQVAGELGSFGGTTPFHVLFHDLVTKQQFPHLLDRKHLNAHQTYEKYTE